MWPRDDLGLNDRWRCAVPQILVLTNSHGGEQEVVLLRERIAPLDLESDHFSARLIERVGWAVVDADDLEHSPPPAERGPAGRAPDSAARAE
jgi:hypothetical protein